MEDITQNIVHQFEQKEIAEQLLQKIKLIQGDIKMDRNHKENLSFLIKFNGEMNIRIAKETILGNKITGFIGMRDEITEWIKIISPKVPDVDIEDFV